MKPVRSQSVVEFKLHSGFDAQRKKLLTDAYSAHREKPLAFWTVPNDRRLPLAFMGWSIQQVLDTPFESLLATPGVGHKKIAALIDLLSRVASQQQPAAEDSPRTRAAKQAAKLDAAPQPGDDGFDASFVSESSWQQWRASVARHRLEKETLGRMARSLQDLPRVMWDAPLETYMNLSLEEIRSLKTHGEKRVRAVVEIFGVLHRMTGTADPVDFMTVRPGPRIVREVEDWLMGTLERETLPQPEEIREHFVVPILEQVRLDLGETIFRLAEGRLGLGGKGSTVKQAAKRLNLTRARVYQLLNEVAAMLAVRWPQGPALVSQLRAKFRHEAEVYYDLDLFLTAVDLFFPQRRRLTATAGSPEEMELELVGG